MSQLKKQLLKLLPKLSKEANQLRDQEARSRWMKLRLIVQSNRSVRRACSLYGWSEDSFNKWGRRLLKLRSIIALLSKSRRPHRSPNQTRKKIERKIINLRKSDPSLGPERIADDLRRFFKKIVSPSAVYAVLKRAKLISQKLSKLLTKRHLKRYRRPLPGYLQMDFKYVPYLINGKQYYQLSCVDHHSSWRHIRVYEEKSTDYVLKFLNELEKHCPFPIMEIQTDNDSAFTDRFTSTIGVTGEHAFDKWCAKRKIVHKLIPVGEKELNGKVENTHKQDDREFYAKEPYRSFENLKLNMFGYNQRWNASRRTKALNFKTPDETIEDAYVLAYVYMHLVAKGRKAIHQLDSFGNACLPIEAPKPEKKIRTRKPTYLERYLKYLEWADSKKKLPALIMEPVMSQNFSLILYDFEWNRIIP